MRPLYYIRTIAALGPLFLGAFWVHIFEKSIIIINNNEKEQNRFLEMPGFKAVIFQGIRSILSKS